MIFSTCVVPSAPWEFDIDLQLISRVEFKSRDCNGEEIVTVFITMADWRLAMVCLLMSFYPINDHCSIYGT